MAKTKVADGWVPGLRKDAEALLVGVGKPKKVMLTLEQRLGRDILEDVKSLNAYARTFGLDRQTLYNLRTRANQLANNASELIGILNNQPRKK